ncbi:hypothetical protein LOK49_LG06G01100 [Camellia lanceoleosa]|uniref:Uncharacterized protein n=1 Tax=Camellia lanceoleosa TaxID=1840588 RepID=A0ACC0HCA0_9ERIC|nr:hypothetical protein LOK49_LG06G01100 [Camellia lanceoleosa]
MVFGKRKHVDDAPKNFEDEEDMMMYEDISTSDDESVEEIDAIQNDKDGCNIGAQARNFTLSREKQVDMKSKPLLDEVIMKGVASRKNLGGAKRWEYSRLENMRASTMYIHKLLVEGDHVQRKELHEVTL